MDLTDCTLQQAVVLQCLRLRSSTSTHLCVYGLYTNINVIVSYESIDAY